MKVAGTATSFRNCNGTMSLIFPRIEVIIAENGSEETRNGGTAWETKVNADERVWNSFDRGMQLFWCKCLGNVNMIGCCYSGCQGRGRSDDLVVQLNDDELFADQLANFNLCRIRISAEFDKNWFVESPSLFTFIDNAVHVSELYISSRPNSELWLCFFSFGPSKSSYSKLLSQIMLKLVWQLTVYIPIADKFHWIKCNNQHIGPLFSPSCRWKFWKCARYPAAHRIHRISDDVTSAQWWCRFDNSHVRPD